MHEPLRALAHQGKVLRQRLGLCSQHDLLFIKSLSPLGQSTWRVFADQPTRPGIDFIAPDKQLADRPEDAHCLQCSCTQRRRVFRCNLVRSDQSLLVETAPNYSIVGMGKQIGLIMGRHRLHLPGKPADWIVRETSKIDLLADRYRLDQLPNSHRFLPSRYVWSAATYCSSSWRPPPATVRLFASPA